MSDFPFEEFVERVRDGSDILNVVQTYVPMKRKGGRYWGCCPFHGEKTPSFSVVPEKGFFYCFGCHAGGNVFKFISLIENVTYWEAVKLQAEKLGIPLPERERTPEEQRREQERQDLMKVSTMARDFFHNCLTMTRLGEPGKTYFAGRGITEATIKEFSLGFAPRSWDKLVTAFRGRGVTDHLLEASGLAARRDNGGLYDRFRGRVIIPIADERGRVVAFGGRVLDDSRPKYLNSPESPIFNKRRLLFGLDRSHRAIKQAGFAIVVEGYMDAIAIFGAGVQNVVATLGTAFTAEHAKLIQRYASRICFCYDSDDAGQNATVRALEILAGTPIEVRVIVVPDGKDPDEFIRRNGAEAFQRLVGEALPVLEYRLRYVLAHVSYGTLEGKVRALQEMAPVLASTRDAARRSEYIKKLSQALLLDEDVVRAELRGYLRTAGGGEPTAQPPQRTVVRERDNALRRSGRIIIRTAWQDPGILAHTATCFPLEALGDTVQREILLYLQAIGAKGEMPDDVTAAENLSEDAAAELSRALVETLARPIEEEYQDAVLALKKAYLNSQFAYHSRLATEYLQSGGGDYRAELETATRIKQEIEKL